MILYRSNNFQKPHEADYPIRCDVLATEELAEVVRWDHVGAEYLHNHRLKTNFVRSDCLMMDVDNSEADREIPPEEWIYPEDVRKAFPGVSVYISYSRNHMKDKPDQKLNGSARPRFHVYFDFADFVEDEAEYSAMKNRMKRLFPAFDKGAKDSSRFFNGVKDPKVEYFAGDTCLDEWLHDHPEAGIEKKPPAAPAPIYPEDLDRDELIDALYHISAGCDNDTWVRIGMILKDNGFDVSVWDAWSQTCPDKYHSGECEKRWRSFHGSDKPVTPKTIFQMARDAGWRPEPKWSDDDPMMMDWNDPIRVDSRPVDSAKPSAKAMAASASELTKMERVCRDMLIQYQGYTEEDVEKASQSPNFVSYEKLIAEEAEKNTQRALKMAEEISGLPQPGLEIDLNDLPDLDDPPDDPNIMAGDDVIRVDSETVSEVTPSAEASKTVTEDQTVKPPIGLVCAESVEYQEPRWLWKPYLQKGKLNCVQGESGAGKTALICALAAAVTTGSPILNSPLQDSGSVLMLSVEDDVAVLRGRFEADGGDVKKLFFMNDAYKLSFGSLEIEQAIQSTGAKLVIFDPLQCFLGANLDFHKANQTRPVLAALTAMAERNDCAILIVAHTGKSTDKSAVYRSLGSADIPAAMRSILHVARDPDDPDECVALHVKSSNEKSGDALSYTIGERGRVDWRGFRDVTIGDIESGKPGRSASVRSECKEFILDALQNGELPSKQLDEQLKMAGFKKDTYSRAKTELKSERKIRYIHSVTDEGNEWRVALTHGLHVVK